ncbi:CBS domain-containing protein [Fulvivirga sedimenti]|uniref:CBS domain-containing protein n=1 Tax=Fulvivirga sedimenti TaxID=2879465 RepID=A0A9X1HY84_9BACT|nr:CBS domain-containing protein [Fulvivirga sedimenti]MCA6078727.1 CBS domain-containing protein [Fulvivirga sedimenti]
MGEHKVRQVGKKDRGHFIHKLLLDIEALEYMLEKAIIEPGFLRIGAEQEFCIVNNDWSPSTSAMEILKAIDDPHFTTELGLFNLELNLDPVRLGPDSFLHMEESLKSLLKKAAEAAKTLDNKILLTGILPTVLKRHLTDDYMTPIPRYKALNDVIRQIRGRDFELHLIGVNELSLTHDSVLFEACNTSFQMHLQIDPDDFVPSYNWAQTIAGPLLAISTNSPLLLGRELWSETRIALFQQSIDTRCTSSFLNEMEPRVTFGKNWIKSVTDIYKDDVARYKILLSSDIEEDSMQVLRDGGIPKLRALNLHNGTIYRWNRPCYGTTNGVPHLRIENRYIPSGPSVIDEIANFALWVGLMVGRPKEYDRMEDLMDFRDVKINFINAARSGSVASMYWMDGRMSVGRLVEEVFIPIAIDGLNRIGLTEQEIWRYMNVIRERIHGVTGARWMIRNYRELLTQEKREDALTLLTGAIHDYQQTELSVNEWGGAGHTDLGLVRHVSRHMTTHLFTAHEHDLAKMVERVMEWKNIHHMPVENSDGEFVGLITSTNIEVHREKIRENPYLTAADIMVVDLITVTEDKLIEEAIDLMQHHGIGSLPVVQDKRLIGILTRNDLANYRNG